VYFEDPAPEGTYERLVEDYMIIREHAGEVECQHKSECAGFGDSWPGAAIQVANLKEAERKAKAAMEAHPEHAVWLAKMEARRAAAVAHDPSLDEDIPF